MINLGYMRKLTQILYYRVFSQQGPLSLRVKKMLSCGKIYTWKAKIFYMSVQIKKLYSMISYVYWNKKK